MADTGAGITIVSADFVRRAGLMPSLRNLKLKLRKKIRLPDGKTLTPLGVVDLPMMIQLMLSCEGIGWVHWERVFTFQDVWVVDLGENSPRDLYISWRDWGFTPGRKAHSPLADLAQQVLEKGARFVDSPRVPDADAPQLLRITPNTMEKFPLMVLAMHHSYRAVYGPTWKEHCSLGPGAPPMAARPDLTPADEPALVSSLQVTGDDGHPPTMSKEQLDEWEARIRARIGKRMRHTPAADTLVAGLLDRIKVFQPLISSECTEVIDFELVETPREVSFRVKPNKRTSMDVYATELGRWESRGIARKVPWSTPSYGFAIMVPKPGGKWRLTMNSSGINPATARFDPDGGYMPESMIQEAMSAGYCRWATKLDMAEAFLTMKLGKTAQELSVFTTPLGKYQWLHGYFGWHSFPAYFQKLVMERVVLPVAEEFTDAKLLAWIDDLGAAAESPERVVEVTLRMIDIMLTFGGRLSLDKCDFLVDRYEWCGVQVDLATNQWRADPARTDSLRDTPIPKDRTALQQVLGILRYYYHVVHDHKAQRNHIAKLCELDKPHMEVAKKWTEHHTRAMKAAFDAVCHGDWLMVYDPTQPIYVSTDASGQHGYCIVANQYERGTGKPRPVAYISKGWESTQLKGWTAQVKECYAQRQAVCNILPKYFPLAKVVLLCDNMNLSYERESEDPRVTRWKLDIKCAEVDIVAKLHFPGVRNNIADYGSRSVHANPHAVLSEEDAFESNFFAYSLTRRKDGGGKRKPPAPGRPTGKSGPASTKGVSTEPAKPARGKRAKAPMGEPPKPVEDPATEPKGRKRATKAAPKEPAQPAKALTATGKGRKQKAVASPAKPAAVATDALSRPSAAHATDGKRTVGPDPSGHTGTGRPTPGPKPRLETDQQAMQRLSLEAIAAKSRATVTTSPLGLAENGVDFDESTASAPSVVPGHYPAAPLVKTIIEAQQAAPAHEREEWKGVRYSTVKIDGSEAMLYKSRLLIPASEHAKPLRDALLRGAHDENYHYAGAERMVAMLRDHARVYWRGLPKDCSEYVNTCVRCKFAKSQHTKQLVGTLTPTVPPYVHHTWYVDVKGPMPNKSGSLLVIVEALTRYVRLRYLNNDTAKELIEEMNEAVWANGTAPVVIRSDGGANFRSAEFEEWCKQRGITNTRGYAHHSQGQGKVETKIRSIASSIIATLGHRAPTLWLKGTMIQELEYTINSTICEPIGGSPFWAMHGFEPRTRLSASVDWCSPTLGADLLGDSKADINDLSNILAAYHSAIHSIQGRLPIATTVAQALTKRKWDATRVPSACKVGDTVLIHQVAPNKLLPHYIGPFKITRVLPGGNFVKARDIIAHPDIPDFAVESKPVHVSRLLHINDARLNVTDMVDFNCEEGSYALESILEHKLMSDGKYHFHCKWYSVDVPTWVPVDNIKSTRQYSEYVTRHGITEPPK